MRFTPIYFRNRRLPQNENKVPFKELYPLKLRNRVTGVAKDSMEDKCLFEMSLLFACWQKTDFDNSQCRDIIQKLNKCYRNLMINMEQQKEFRKRDVPTPGAKVLTDKQLSYLLRRYPTV